jgi:hypothetical protein
MYMRDLACCANGKAFYSTPSDLVRFALATNPGSVNGELAGGIVIAVTSNMAHAMIARRFPNRQPIFSASATRMPSGPRT